MLPWYLIIGRPYPLQVYQYAISYYSANPGIGQRGAAAATREKYGLKTFSHSTVSRSFKSFEKARKTALEKKFGKEIIINDAEDIIIISAAPKCASVEKTAHIDTGENPCNKGRFPTVGDTAERRRTMSGFLPELKKDASRMEIEAAGRRFARNWHEKTRRLLL